MVYMERRRRGDQQEMGNNNNNPQIIDGSPPVPVLKLPLAPILSTDRINRPNNAIAAMLSTRRGSSIFSPTHHPPPPAASPADPHPDPTTPINTAGTASNSKNSPPLPPQPPQSPVATNSSVIYKECLKNHAASMGAHVVDGCGEFMLSTLESSLKCAACDCHRNFHRKEVHGDPPQQSHSHHYTYHPNSSGNNNNSNSAPPSSLHCRTPVVLSAPPHLMKHHFAANPTPPSMVNFGGGAAAESSSEDLGRHAAGAEPSKKRLRTKFSQDQKDGMHEFAMKIGWRIQKQDEQKVQQFCSEVGVKRQVFKVWMHNNKQGMKKIKEKLEADR